MESNLRIVDQISSARSELVFPAPLVWSSKAAVGPQVGRLLGLLLLLVCALSTGCKRKPPAPPVPAGELLGEGFVFEAAVYHFAPPPANVKDEAKAVFAAASIAVGETAFTIVPKVPTAVILSPPVSELPPPSLDFLRHSARGLDDAAKEALQHPAAVTALRISGPAAKAVPSYRAALRALLAIEKAGPGAILDDETRETFSREKLTARAEAFSGPVPVIREHVVVHVYKSGSLLRAVSLGMRKLGLPDMAVSEVSHSNSEAMVSLMTYALQSFAEHPALPEAGKLALDIPSLAGDPKRDEFAGGASRPGTGKGTLHLVQAKPEEGDADNRLIGLDFPGPEKSLHERQAKALATILGSGEGPMVMARPDDAELERARERARAKVMTLKPRWRDGPDVEGLLVKGPFRTSSGGVEWMWVEVTRWRGKTLDGILQNEPFDVPKLKPGARVTVDEGEIFDFIHRLPDGGVEGNETSRILQSRK